VLCLGACTIAPSPAAPSAVATADTLAVVDGFDPVFFRAFVQNGYDTPDHLEPIRILQGPFRVYLRTQDESGRAIDAVTLDMTERVLIDTANVWAGGTFGISEVARGTATREKVAGWLTVKWSSVAQNDRCGRSTVGIDGGSIEFNTSGACSCGAGLIYPRLIRHELGHAMGYYHTDGVDDVMYGRTITSDACDVSPSARERRHARLAHDQAR
jgi:hypothetical protein